LLLLRLQEYLVCLGSADHGRVVDVAVLQGHGRLLLLLLLLLVVLLQLLKLEQVMQLLRLDLRLRWGRLRLLRQLLLRLLLLLRLGRLFLRRQLLLGNDRHDIKTRQNQGSVRHQGSSGSGGGRGLDFDDRLCRRSHTDIRRRGG